MHLFIFARGEWRCLQRFFEELSSKYVNFTFQKFDDETKKFIVGTKENYAAQITIKAGLPLNVVEVTFPEGARDTVLTSLLGKYNPEPVWHQWIYTYVSFLRVLMKLEKVPKYDDAHHFPLFKDHIEIIPIGIKYDEKDELGNEYI